MTMGKPRLIILIRHAQSEGNKNREIHQFIPDHRVKLTAEGWGQAEDAGRRLRKILRKDDTIRIFTSPYRRTRETTEGMMRTLTADDDETGPSPFQRQDIKVYEEPRLREQDFGNFQPCSVEMERIFQERADYGHFYYRIANGESAADAYDRVCGFNESLWRQFSEPDFPSVCILVTHGLMTRVFLMKWYRWTPEYFEDLRNIRHTEFITMEKNDKDKYDLMTKLRTWSELRENLEQTDPSAAAAMKPPTSPKLPGFRWGGCAQGCNHGKMKFPRKTKRGSVIERPQQQIQQPEQQNQILQQHQWEQQNQSLQQQQWEQVLQSPVQADEHDDLVIGAMEAKSMINSPKRALSLKKLTSSTILHPFEMSSARKKTARTHQHHDEAADTKGQVEQEVQDETAADKDVDSLALDESQGLSLPLRSRDQTPQLRQHPPHLYLHPGRDGGGSESGVGSPAESPREPSDAFDAKSAQSSETAKEVPAVSSALGNSETSSGSAAAMRLSGNYKASAHPLTQGIRPSAKTMEEWVRESGIVVGRSADGLGDFDQDSEEIPGEDGQGHEQLKQSRDDR